MTNCTGDSCVPPENTYIEELIYEAISGWVSYLHIKKSSRGELRTSCDHLASLSSDLAHIPKPHTPCQVCQDPDDNWLCLSCKGVFCSGLVNKHNQEHRGKTLHCLGFHYKDLSFWCNSCNAYLDAQVIEQLRPLYIKAYIQKFALKGPLAAARQRKIQTSSSCSTVQSIENKEDKSCVMKTENTYIEELIYEAISGWVSYLHIKKSSRGELRTSCDHLASLSSDLAHIPKPHTPCQVCQDPDDNVLCLCCKGVFCSRLVNKHNQEHRRKTDDCLEFVYRNLSFACISCRSDLDAQAIEQLRPVYIKAYIQKFALKGPLAAALQRKIQTSSSCSAVQSFDNKEDKSCPIKTNPSQTNKSCNGEITFLNRKCECGETADLKISQSKENPNKLIYCCPKKGDGCNFLAMWERDDPACSIVGGSSSKQEICLNFKNDAAPIPDIGAPTSNPRILERIVALEANVAAGKMLVLFNLLVVFLGLFVMVCVLVKI